MKAVLIISLFVRDDLNVTLPLKLYRRERIEPVVMSGGEETTSQRRGGVDGNQTDRETETDTEKEKHWPHNKPRDSSMMNDAGKTASGARKTRSRTLAGLKKETMAQMLLLQRKRCPTLDCRGR